MHVFYCMLLCLAAFTLVRCNETNKCCQDLKSFRQPISIALFHPQLVYNNKKYLISNFAHRNVADAMTYCAALGGYLAEIDDDKEYKALQSFVLNSPPTQIVIGGSDAAKEGTWIFPRTGLPVKILDWVKNMPDNLNGDENCLSLWKNSGAKMNDETCGLRNAGYRFMCEMPNTF